MLKIAIVVPCYNRVSSLERLLQSLSHADYGECSGEVSLIFSVDYSGDDKVAEFVQSFEWGFGEKRVILHPTNVGLRKNILSCGDLTAEFDAVIVLEDDLVVSPGFYSYAIQSAEYYEDDSRIAQLSLYSYEYAEVGVSRFMPVEDGNDVYFMQWASSWGQMWTTRQWKTFRSWYALNDSDSLNELSMPEYVKGWPATSWKKFFIGYLVDTNRYVVYPRVGYSSCFGDAGAHRSVSMLPVVNSPLAFCAPKDFRFVTFLGSYVRYDSFFEPAKYLMDVLCPELAVYDYEVDFNGMKPLDELSAEYLLSTRTSSCALHSYSWNVRPMGVLLSISPNALDISLGRTESFDSSLGWCQKIRLAYWVQACLGARRSMLYAIIRFFSEILKKPI